MTATPNNRMMGFQELLSAAGAAAVRAPSRAAAALPGSELPAPAPLPVPLPASAVSWLAQAALLYGVPFQYIIPDDRMLPKESIRFFYVDRNWQHRLIEGAVSIGMSSSADTLQLMATIEQIIDAAIQKTPAVRATMRGVAEPSDTTTIGPITGFLLRSVAVTGWPGMEVSAYSDATDGPPLRTLRMDRLSDDVLLMLFDGLPHRVEILQPPEGLHFGIRPQGDTYVSSLRGLGYPEPPSTTYVPGAQICSKEVVLKMRDSAAPGVLDVAASAANLKTAMLGLGALDPSGTFTSAEFAVQMVRAAGMQRFKWGVTITPGPQDKRSMTR